jgi:hypothetical protein
VTPIATNIPTPSGNPTPQPTAEISSKLTPVATQSSSGGASNSGISPTVANSGIATNSRTDTSSGTSVNSGSSMGTYSSGSSYTSGYGNYQSSSTAGSAKTGETRPFTVMARIGILGLLLLALGSFFFIKTKKREHEDE